VTSGLRGHPTANGSRFLRIEKALFHPQKRKRIAKIPPDRTKYDAGFGLPPSEDRRSDYHLAILSCRRSATLKVATHPEKMIEPLEKRHDRQASKNTP
jgi:hypothetical protein